MMIRTNLLVVGALVLLMTAPILAADGGAGDVLKELYPSHPRLFIHADDIAALKALIKSDDLAKRWHDKLVADAQRMLAEKPVEHVLIGPRLLDKSRTALHRITTLSALYLIDGDKRFAERAKQEIFTVIAFQDWNPSHFLDTAEMSNAVGIGYDWLFDYLTPDERRQIRAGLVQLGLQVGLDGFEKEPKAWWTKATHNWSQVCNGGLTVGALAVADEEKEVASKLISLCRAAIKPSMNAFAPDGGFPEGPGYWGYATSYNVYYLAALESALKTDFGLNQMPGFDVTGFYRMHAVGPIGRSFNYADAGDRAGSAAQMFYLARIFKQPAFTAHELGQVGDNASIFHLIWYSQYQISNLKSKITNQNSTNDIDLDALYRGVNVAYFRSAWNDRNALYVGVKGGDNRVNHSHLDLGCFVLDTLGQRWAVDLGPDDYNLPGFFGNKRWTYYRLRTESHNTITLDGENQSTDGKAPIIAYRSSANRSHAVIDLTHGYRTQAKKMLRGLAMLDRSAVLVQDEIEAAKPVDVVWNFLTAAKVEIQDKTATLSQGAARLEVRILSPQDASFQVISANPPPPQRQQPEVKNLTVRLPSKVTQTRIVVLITPAGKPVPQVAIEPLEQWPGTLAKP
jgi:hypothetical protein